MKKQKMKSKTKREAPKKKATNKGKCFNYNVDDHWKMNYPLDLEFLKKKKKDMPSKGMSNLLVIETNFKVSSTSSWIIDWF